MGKKEKEIKTYGDLADVVIWIIESINDCLRYGDFEELKKQTDKLQNLYVIYTKEKIIDILNLVRRLACNANEIHKNTREHSVICGGYNKSQDNIQEINAIKEELNKEIEE